MSVGDRYEINVAKLDKGRSKPAYVRHFMVEVNRPFCHVATVYAELKERYPEPDYKLSVTRWEERGYPVDMKGI